MLQSSLFAAALFVPLLTESTNCFYPDFPGGEGSDYRFVEQGLQIAFVEGFTGFETPIFAELGFAIGTYQWDCQATYSEGWQALRREGRPLVADLVPASERTLNNSAACYAYATQVLVRFIRGAFGTNTGDFFENSWGLRGNAELEVLYDETVACDFDETCLNDVAASYGYCGDIMGMIVGVTTVDTLLQDGFNADGSQTPFGECTGFCQKYSDPIGFYDPRVNVKKLDFYKPDLVPGFNFKRNPYPWEPLRETNGQGYFTLQQHITPHIGFTASPLSFGRRKFENLVNRIDAPDYNYRKESRLLLERLRVTATDARRKAIIETLDDKIGVGALMQFSHWIFFNPTYEQNVIFETGQRTAEYEGVLIAWRAKMKYNLVRPTTVIQSGRFTKRFIDSYGGPFQGVQTIRAQDFQPYIRTMPHSEYPSGSTCICRLWLDHINEWVANEYGAETLPILFRFFSQTGGSKSEPGGEQESISFVWNATEQLYQNCAESRLWGGMHYTDSVPASDKLCDNIGDGIYDYVQSRLPKNTTRRRRLSAAQPVDPYSAEAKAMFDNYMDGLMSHLEMYMDKEVGEAVETVEEVSSIGYFWVVAAMFAVLVLGFGSRRTLGKNVWQKV